MKKLVIAIIFVVLLVSSSIYWLPYLSFLGKNAVNPDSNEALLYLIPKKETYKVGDTISVAFRIGTSSPIISLLTSVNYDPALVSVTEVNKEGSIFLSWWEDVVDSKAGEVRLQASLPSPGFKGTDGLIAVITMVVLKEGELVLDYNPSSLALKEDDSNIINIGKSARGIYTLKNSSGFDFPFF